MTGVKDLLGDTLFSERPAPYPDGIPAEICDLFEKLALEVHRAGFRHYSSDAVLHRIRWYHHIEKGNRDFKCNDHFTAPLARWFLARHPELAKIKFFEIRERKGE